MLLSVKRIVLSVAILGLLFLVFSFEGAWAAKKSWGVTTGVSLSQVYTVPQPGRARFTMKRAHYDIQEEMFMIDLAAMKESDLAQGQAAPSHQVVYIIRPKEKRAHWLRTIRREDAFTDYVFSIPPYGEKLTLSSTALRQAGKDIIIHQPFGAHTIRLHIEEKQHYKPWLSNDLLGTGKQEMEKQFGRGHVSLDVLTSEGDVIFSLRDEYNDNSRIYDGYWSPDGRYIFLQLPAQGSGDFTHLEHLISNSFMIIGPFSSSTSSAMIWENLQNQRTQTPD